MTSKAALIGLTRAIARELGSRGITANAICPGAFPTAAEKIQGDPERYARFVLDHQSIKRRGTPQDFTYALLFLASAHSGFITGQALNVDGGVAFCAGRGHLSAHGSSGQAVNRLRVCARLHARHFCRTSRQRSAPAASWAPAICSAHESV